MIKKIFFTVASFLVCFLYAYSTAAAAIMPFTSFNQAQQREQQRLAYAVCADAARHKLWLKLQLQIEWLKSQSATSQDKAGIMHRLEGLAKQQKNLMNQRSWVDCSSYNVFSRPNIFP